MTWNKLLNTFISPLQTKKSSQSIIQSLNGTPSELYSKAIIFQSEKNFTESLALLIQAYESANKLYGSDNEKTIFLLSELAKGYKILGRNVETAKYYQETLDRMTKSGIEMPNTLEILKNLSAIYINVTADFTKALPVQTRIVSIEENLENVTKFQLATSIGDLAYLKLQLGQYNDAITLDKRALILFGQAQATESSEAILLRNHLAISYIWLEENDRAMYFLEEALNILKKKGKHELINGLIYNNMALISRNKGLYQEAANLQEKALAIDAELEPNGGVNTITLLDNLGVSYQVLGDYKNLLPVLQKRVAINKRISGLAHSKTFDAILNLAATLEGMGKYDEALLELKFIDDIPENNDLIAIKIAKILSMFLKGGVYYKNGDIFAANQILSQAMGLAEKLTNHDNLYTKMIMAAVAFTYLELGDINNATRLSTSLQDHIKALPELTFNKQNILEMLNATTRELSLFVSAKVKLAQNKPFDAITLEAKSLALDYIYSIQTKEVIADRLYELSKTMIRINPNAAIALSKMGINISQSLRFDIAIMGTENLQIFTKSIKDRYQLLAEMLTKQRRLEEAQEVIDLLKVSEFNQYTNAVSKKDPLVEYLPYTKAEQVLVTGYETISTKIANQSNKLKILNIGAKTQSEQNLAIALVKELNKNQEVFVEYIKSIAVNTTKTTFPETQPTAESLAYLKKLQETIKNSGSDVALLRYYLTEDSLGVIITGASGQFSKSVAIKNSELSKKIVNFNQLLRNPKLDPRPAAEKLYTLVFKPFTEDLEKLGAKTVMLSLDGILRYIPFAALYDGKHYLVESYRLPIFTSATSDTLNRSASPAWQVSAMGVTHSIRNFPALPGVQAEVDGIVRHGSEGILPGEILLDNNFTSLALKEATKQNFPVLHIASHFVFSPGTEVNSFLLMGDGQELTLGDIRTQNFDFSHVDLLTLSACETGMGGGVDDDGREIEGFGVTAQRQGAKSVLATLWPVADKSTAILMKDFYQLHQEQKLSKAEALREAQLDMLNGTQDHIIADKKNPATTQYKIDPTKPYAHPFYWAPFIMMGNWT